MAPIFTVTSYNSHGRGKEKLHYIQKLSNISDFLLIQEHWLQEKDNNFFNKHLQNVNSHVTSGMDPTELLHGRPFGGCAILWKSNLQHAVIPVHVDSKRLCAVKMISDDKTILIINVYMPCFKPNETLSLTI